MDFRDKTFFVPFICFLNEKNGFCSFFRQFAPIILSVSSFLGQKLFLLQKKFRGRLIDQNTIEIIFQNTKIVINSRNVS